VVVAEGVEDAATWAELNGSAATICKASTCRSMPISDFTDWLASAKAALSPPSASANPPTPPVIPQGFAQWARQTSALPKPPVIMQLSAVRPAVRPTLQPCSGVYRSPFNE